jgi:hypothetical protein
MAAVLTSCGRVLSSYLKYCSIFKGCPFFGFVDQKLPFSACSSDSCEDGKQAPRSPRRSLALLFVSILPLDRAAHRGHLLHRAVAGLSFLLQASKRPPRAFATCCMREVSSRPRYCNSSWALKLKKSGVHCIGSRHTLCLIDNVGEGEAELRGEGLHIVERVLAISLCIVPHNGEGADTERCCRPHLHRNV